MKPSTWQSIVVIGSNFWYLDGLAWILFVWILGGDAPGFPWSVAGSIASAYAIVGLSFVIRDAAMYYLTDDENFFYRESDILSKEVRGYRLQTLFLPSFGMSVVLTTPKMLYKGVRKFFRESKSRHETTHPKA